jgi:ABC-2 type transport system permease protein
VRRYARLFAIQLRTSLQTGMQYRWDFIVEGLTGLFFALLGLLPLWVFKRNGAVVPGWGFPEMLVVVGWFTLLKGLIDGAVNPSLIVVVDHIRRGTLDFVLIKPADAQFLVSTAKFEPWRVLDALVGVGICVAGFVALGRWPTALALAGALVMLASACLVLYSTWILVVSAAFWVVRLDNLAYLFMSIFDFARWPVTVFRGVIRFAFTFVIPLALMTTYPTMALLGTLRPATGLLAIGGALAFTAMARLVWQRAIARYTSASS